MGQEKSKLGPDNNFNSETCFDLYFWSGNLVKGHFTIFNPQAPSVEYELQRAVWGMNYKGQTGEQNSTDKDS